MHSSTITSGQLVVRPKKQSAKGLKGEEIPQRALKKKATKKKAARRPQVGQVLSTSTPGGIQALTEGGALDGMPQAPQRNGKGRKLSLGEVREAAGVFDAATKKPPAAGPVRELELEEIASSPFQVRSEFDEAELAKLAASLEVDGLLQAIVVRPASRHVRGGQAFELIAGERRVRAARLAGWETIPGKVIDVDDAKAAELVIVENLNRQDLSAIEEAHGFQRLIAEHGFTQQQVGERFHISQPQVANRLSLLKLPADWQQRIITREIPPTHARLLVPLKDEPKVLAALAKELKRDGCPSLSEWEECIDSEVRQLGKPLKGTFWDRGGRGRREVAFTPTDEQRAELRIVELKNYSGKPEEYALNVKLWEQLQAEGEKQRAKRAESKAGKGQGKKQAKKLTPAQQRDKDEKLAEQFVRKLKDWKVDWLRMLVARRVDNAVDPPANDFDLRWRLLVWLSCVPGDWKTDREAVLVGVLPRQSRKGRGVEDLLWAELAAIDPQGLDLDNTIAAYLAGLFYSEKEGPRKFLPAELVEAVAAELSIDLADAWNREQAGPLSETYFQLHDKEQLAALAGELGVYAEPNQTKASLVKKLLGSVASRAQLPAELAGPKPKAQRKKPAKVQSKKATKKGPASPAKAAGKPKPR